MHCTYIHFDQEPLVVAVARAMAHNEAVAEATSSVRAKDEHNIIWVVHNHYACCVACMLL